jgi:TP901 family phage tail tape measure protein
MATEVGVGYVRLVPSARGFGTQAERELGRELGPASERVGRESGRSLTDSMATSMESTGGTLTKGVTVPLLGIGATALKMSGDFEASMNGVRAVTGASGKDFDALKDKAKELGSTTQFSASEAANAMEFLGMAGWETSDVLSGLPDVLNLAAASGLDLASAADISSNIMSGFGIKAEEAAKVSDVLAKAAASANVDVAMLGESMKYAAPLASAAGWSLEETAAAVGILGDAGIQGSMAGTGMNSILATLADTASSGGKKLKEFGVAAKDSNGEVRPLTDVLADLADEGADVADVIGIFGLEAGPKMQALLGRGSEGLRDLITDLENSEGAAEEMAAIRMEGFNGSVKELSSAFEGLMIAIGESGLLEYATDLVAKITGWTQRLSESNPEMLKMATVVGAVVAAIGPLLIVLAKVMRATVAAVKTFARFAVGTYKVVAGFVRMTIAAVRFLGRMVMVVARFTAMAVRMAAQMALTVARVVAGWVLMGIQATLQAIRMAAAWIIAMGPVAWITAAVIALVALIIANWDTIKEWTVKIWEAVWGFIKDMAEKVWNLFLDWTIVGLVIKHWDTIKEKTEQVWNAIVEWVKSIPGKLYDAFLNFTLIGRIVKHWDTIKTKTQTAWNNIVTWITRIPGRFVSGLSGMARKLWNVAKGAFQDFRDGAADRVTKMVEWVTKIPSRITRGIGSVTDLLYQKGKDIVSGLWSGIQAMGSWLKEKISGFVSSNIPGPIKSVLGIRSPSRFMRDEIGRMIPAGLVEGITAGEGAVEAAMRHLVSAPDTPRLPAMAGAMAGGLGTAPQSPQLVLAPSGTAAGKALMRLLQESLRNDYGGKIENLNTRK